MANAEAAGRSHAYDHLAARSHHSFLPRRSSLQTRKQRQRDERRVIPKMNGAPISSFFQVAVPDLPFVLLFCCRGARPSITLCPYCCYSEQLSGQAHDLPRSNEYVIGYRSQFSYSSCCQACQACQVDICVANCGCGQLLGY